MPHAGQGVRTAEVIQNWNDHPAQGKSGVGKGADDEALAGRAGGDGLPGGQQFPHRSAAAGGGIGVERDVHHGRKSSMAGEQGRAVAFADRAAEPRGLGMDQPTLAPNAPVVLEHRIYSGLAHGVATEQDGFHSGEGSAGSEVDLDVAVEPAAGEENGFLRQPVQVCAGSDAQGSGDLRIATDGAVDAFAGLGGEHRVAGSCNIHRPVKNIATRQPTGGVDQNGLERVAMSIGQSDLGAAFLVELQDARGLTALLGRKTAQAAGTLQQNAAIRPLPASNSWFAHAFTPRANALMTMILQGLRKMRFKSVVSAAALAASLGFAGVAHADTMVGATNVTDVDLPRVQAYCEQLASGMTPDSPTGGAIDVTETDTDTTEPPDSDQANQSDNNVGDDEPTLDLGQITLENCIDAGLAPAGAEGATTTTN